MSLGTYLSLATDNAWLDYKNNLENDIPDVLTLSKCPATYIRVPYNRQIETFNEDYAAYITLHRTRNLHSTHLQHELSINNFTQNIMLVLLGAHTFQTKNTDIATHAQMIVHSLLQSKEIDISTDSFSKVLGTNSKLVSIIKLLENGDKDEVRKFISDYGKIDAPKVIDRQLCFKRLIKERCAMKTLVEKFNDLTTRDIAYIPIRISTSPNVLFDDIEVSKGKKNKNDALQKPDKEKIYAKRKERAKKLKTVVINTIKEAFPVEKMPFSSMQECKSKAKKEMYYISRESLIKMIENDPDLKKYFGKRGIKSMSKDDLCKTIFSFNVNTK